MHFDVTFNDTADSRAMHVQNIVQFFIRTCGMCTMCHNTTLVLTHVIFICQNRVSRQQF